MRFLLRFVVAIFVVSASVHAQSKLPAGELALKSGGTASESGWRLTENGYVGTYLKVAAAGKAAISVRASGLAGQGAAPHLNLVVADQHAGFDVGREPRECVLETSLPAGVYIARVEFTNAQPAWGRAITIASLDVSGAAGIVNLQTDANALAAADTYAERFRRGEATVQLAGVAPGTPVHVRLIKHAFNFGACLTIERNDKLLIENPPAGSDAARYQQFVTSGYFNTIVAGNAGKWAYNEPKPGEVEMQLVDRLIAFGKAHGLRVRMHNLIWGNQQPDWVHELLKRALAGDAAAKTELRQAISRRIGYYVRDRAGQVVDIDVLNEALRNDNYWKIFGADGIADIHNECATALKSAGSNALLYTNEYNVFQWSFVPAISGKESADPYANWYLREVEAIRAAGGAVTGIGVQYYADISKNAQTNGPHSAARIAAALNNLAVAGLPIELTEFGVQRGQDKTGDPQLAAQALEETMRLTFGCGQVNGFIIWGFRMPWLWNKADVGALLDADWKPTPAGERFLTLMKKWMTDLTIPAGPDGTIQFTGFYGDYELSASGKTYPLKLVKGTSTYQLSPTP